MLSYRLGLSREDKTNNCCGFKRKTHFRAGISRTTPQKTSKISRKNGFRPLNMHAGRKVSCHCYLSALICLFVSQADNAKTAPVVRGWMLHEDDEAKLLSNSFAEVVLSKTPQVIWVETEIEPFLLPSSSPPFPFFCFVLKKKSNR